MTRFKNNNQHTIGMYQDLREQNNLAIAMLHSVKHEEYLKSMKI